MGEEKLCLGFVLFQEAWSQTIPDHDSGVGTGQGQLPTNRQFRLGLHFMETGRV